MRLRVFLFIAFLFTACASHAAVFTVTNVGDSEDGLCDAHCSLREAIVAANLTPSDDSIEFSAAVFASPQTIVMSGSELTILDNGTLDINGPGTDLLTIDGNNSSRVFLNQTGAVTTINQLSITKGDGSGAVNSGRGGGVYNTGGDLTLNAVNLFGNSATNGGATNNGNSGTLTINNCHIYDNMSVSTGGAMQNFSGSSLFVFNSTISNNTSNFSGSGGGGGLQGNGEVTLINSTFSGNQIPSGTGGGILYNGSLLNMTNVTITGNSAGANGGGFRKSTTNTSAVLTNNLIAGNLSGGTPLDVVGTIISGGGNLIGAPGESMGWEMSDILSPPNPTGQVGPLRNNGGPTPTHALTDNSLARDNGVSMGCPETDQRGVVRQQSRCDIGAVENDADTCYIVPAQESSVAVFCL